MKRTGAAPGGKRPGGRERERRSDRGWRASRSACGVGVGFGHGLAGRCERCQQGCGDDAGGLAGV